MYRNICQRFQPNQFNKQRCQQCFKQKDAHSDAALENSKMSRKVTNRGYLFIAPENFNIASPSLSRRWQRRWFSLFDDGELAYALDPNPETVPHGMVDMTRCQGVTFVESVGSHQNCLCVQVTADKSIYVKGESYEEIAWWYNILGMYGKSAVKTSYLTATTQERCSLTDSGNLSQSSINTSSVDLEHCDHSSQDSGTVIEIGKSRGRRSATERSERRLSEPLSAAKVDISRGDSFHGTPRSVKNRHQQRCKEHSNEDEESCRRRRHRRCWSDISGAQVIDALETANTHLPHTDNTNSLDHSQPSKVDVSTMHTVRKGWLMVRGRSDNDWIKHWAVLTGLSLKFFKDAWTEDHGTAAMDIDLCDCQGVYPTKVSRSYGIEIRNGKSRHVLSAMTPGIRDSWITAIQQNLSNPSPTLLTDHLNHSSADAPEAMQKKKRIAYVTPESHHRSNTDVSSSDAEELHQADVSRDDVSLSERWVRLNADSESERATGRSRQSSGSVSESRPGSVSPTVRRSPVSRIKERSSRRQLSPNVARDSSLNRSSAPPSSQRLTTTSVDMHIRSTSTHSVITSVSVRERRNQQRNSPARRQLNNSGVSECDFGRVNGRYDEQQRRGSIGSVGSVGSAECQSPALTPTWIESVGHLEQQNQLLRLRLLETQVESLRDELENARERLSATEVENRRLLQLSSAPVSTLSHQEELDLERLRCALAEAEQDVFRKQEEIECLRDRLDRSIYAEPPDNSDTNPQLTQQHQEQLEVKEEDGQWQDRYGQLEAEMADPHDQADSLQKTLAHKTEMLQMVQAKEEANKSEISTLKEHLCTAREEISELHSFRSQFENQAELIQKLQKRVNDMESLDLDKQLVDRATVTSPFTEQQLATMTNESDDVCTARQRRKFLESLIAHLEANRSDDGEWVEVRQSLSEVRQMLDTVGQSSCPTLQLQRVEAQLQQMLIERSSVSTRVGAGRVHVATMTNVSPPHASDSVLSDSGVPGLNASANTAAVSSLGDSNTASNLFSFLYDYNVGAVHDELSRSLLTLLREKLTDVVSRPISSAEHLQQILAETAALEITLLSETCNILETCGDELLLSTSMCVHEVRSCAIILCSVCEALEQLDPLDANADLPDSLHNFKLSSFPALCAAVGQSLMASVQAAKSAIPLQSKDSLQFVSADEQVSFRPQLVLSLALTVARGVISLSLSQSSVAEQAVSNLEMKHLLARFQHLAAADSHPVESLDQLRRMLTVGVTHVTRSAITICEKIDFCLRTRNIDPENLPQSVALKVEIEKYWTDLKSGLQSDTNGLSSKWASVDSEVSAVTESLVCNLDLNTPIASIDFQTIGKLLVIKAIAQGLEKCISVTKDNLASDISDNTCLPQKEVFNRNLLEDLKTAMQSAQNVNQRFTNNVEAAVSNLQLEEWISYYQPLTRQLVQQMSSNAVIRIACSLSHVDHRWQQPSDDSESWNKNSHREECGQCCERSATIIALQTEISELKRSRSLAEEIDQNRSETHKDQLLQQLRQDLETLQIRFERQRRSLKEEAKKSRLAAEAQVGDEMKELEQELLDMQTTHSEEMDSIRADYEHQLSTLRDQFNVETERRKKIQADMQHMKTLGDQSMSVLQRSHAQLISNIRAEHDSDIDQLRTHYEQQLKEEKEATRHAIDALQKAHRVELQKQSERSRNSSILSHCSSQDTNQQPTPLVDRRQSQMLEQMSRELSELSAAYSTKCLENSQLEEELADLKASVIEKNSTSHKFVEFHESNTSKVSSSSHYKTIDFSSRSDHGRSSLNLESCKTIADLQAEIIALRTELEDVKSVHSNTPSTGNHVKPSIIPQMNNANAVKPEDDSDSQTSNNSSTGDVVKRKRLPGSIRRNDNRFHSTPNVEESLELINADESHAVFAEHVVAEHKIALGIPVSERRKFFESLGKK